MPDSSHTMPSQTQSSSSDQPVESTEIKKFSDLPLDEQRQFIVENWDKLSSRAKLHYFKRNMSQLSPEERLEHLHLLQTADWCTRTGISLEENDRRSGLNHIINGLGVREGYASGLSR